MATGKGPAQGIAAELPERPRELLSTGESRSEVFRFFRLVLNEQARNLARADYFQFQKDVDPH
ncbi:hypothetical protein HDU93_005954, partial [Gonapodya sp. JEL0774]